MHRMVVKTDRVRRGTVAGMTSLVVVLAVAGCGSARPAALAQTSVPASGPAVGAELAAPVTFGTGTADELLTLAPPGDDTRAVVPESVARNDVDHPSGSPKLLRQVLFTKARATAAMLGGSGTGAPVAFRSTLAWVAVFEVDPHSPHSCPAQPAPSPVSLPPLQAHYYFAVLVDATTGAQATWNEDASGLVMRQCAEQWSRIASNS